MKRACASALLLVNWRGVFYQRYLLDRLVTALEGENGAGKTTVLIAGYVALMPDLTRLRFTNVGEQGTSGGDRGLWGRLGEPGAPSYAAIDFALPSGDRFIACVQLNRKAEPAVELETFVIDGVRPDVALQDLFLVRGELDRVPNTAELRENVAKAGAVLKECDSAKDYFGALFERGVIPLRLASDEERIKFNEMLRSSMAGGISRTLTSELRQFLLKEETGLADTLSRMRANLEACRQTRIEVGEAARLEEEIHSVYESGEEMFAAAVLATRERAAELKRRRDDAIEAHSKAVEVEAERREAFEEAARVLASAKEVVAAARAAEDRAKAASVAVQQAHRIAQRIQGLAQESAAASEKLERTASARKEQERLAAVAKEERDRARDAYDAAAAGLADLQKGLEELVRRAGQHRVVSRKLEDLRSALAPDRVDVDRLPSMRQGLVERKERATAELASNEREVETAQLRSREFERVIAILRRLLVEDREVDPGEAWKTGRQVLAELRDAEDLLGARGGLEAERERCARLATVQTRTRDRAATLGVTRDDGATWASTVRIEWDRTEGALREQEEVARVALGAAKEHDAAAIRQSARIAGLEVDFARWTDLTRRAASLVEEWQQPAGRATDLLRLRSWLQETHATHSGAIAEGERRRVTLRADIASLELAGGSPDPRMAKAKDVVGGELVSDHFDDISLGEAGEQEALLGPLVHAVIVEDAAAAARKLVAAADRPDTVWLVDKPAALRESGEGKRLDGSVFVDVAAGGRLTRIPDRPVLGRIARERRLQELREEDRLVIDQLAIDESRVSRITFAFGETDLLLQAAALLEREDPEVELASARIAARKAEHDAKHERAHAATAQEEIDRLAPRLGELRGLQQDGWVLDEADFGERQRLLDARLAQVRAADARLREAGPQREELRLGIDALRILPLAPEELSRLQARVREQRSDVDSMHRVLADVDHVLEHRVALEWADAADALAKTEGLVPSLEKQCSNAKEHAHAAEEAVLDRDGAVGDARRNENEAHAAASILDAALARDRKDLTETGIDDASAAAVEAAELDVTRSGTRAREAEAGHLGCAEESSRLGLLLEQARKEVGEKKTEAETEEQKWTPQQERWEQLQATATKEGLLGAAMSGKYLERFGEKGSIHVWAQARAAAGGLLQQLRRSNDGEAIAAEIGATIDAEDQVLSDLFLGAWRSVRTWLRRRVPPQISEESDPLAALLRLRDHLRSLQARLGTQEEDLRGESQNVARNIDIHIRRARKQVTALSGSLATVRFGSIESVRIDVRQVERMGNVLEALRSGKAQDLLFGSSMPIEDALNALFERHAGGKTGGQKLLDYREYLDLRVEVMRKGGKQWEPANSVKMSTGEAIGVGASLMMVILAAWEKDANLLRGKRAFGTLRLLFLDEANRLSPESLLVLFELCGTLELQLVIAAPEIAQASGNTTYRLVRQVDAEGREVVIASGRRPRVVG